MKFSSNSAISFRTQNGASNRAFIVLLYIISSYLINDFPKQLLETGIISVLLPSIALKIAFINNIELYGLKPFPAVILLSIQAYIVYAVSSLFSKWIV